MQEKHQLSIETRDILMYRVIRNRVWFLKISGINSEATFPLPKFYPRFNFYKKVVPSSRR